MIAIILIIQRVIGTSFSITTTITTCTIIIIGHRTMCSLIIIPIITIAITITMVTILLTILLTINPNTNNNNKWVVTLIHSNTLLTTTVIIDNKIIAMGLLFNHNNSQVYYRSCSHWNFLAVIMLCCLAYHNGNINRITIIITITITIITQSLTNQPSTWCPAAIAFAANV